MIVKIVFEQSLFFFLSFAAAIVGVVYMNVLSYEKVMNWWFKFGDRLCTSDYGGCNPKRRFEWFYLPVWGCFKCFTGQVCLWGYLILYWNHYNVFVHIFTICFGIFLSILFNKLLNIRANG